MGKVSSISNLSINYNVKENSMVAGIMDTIFEIGPNFFALIVQKHLLFSFLKYFFCMFNFLTMLKSVQNIKELNITS